MKAMVLAAGKGTRLGELTRDLPKPMLEVAGQPILGHILLHLARHGFREVVINLHHQAQAIQDHFGDGSRWGVRITYLREPELLGTAGSVRNASACFADPAEPFLVQYGDVITDQDLTAMTAAHRARGALASLLLHRRARSNSIVQLGPDQRVLRLLERPTESEREQVAGEVWVNSGVYLLQPAVLASIPARGPADFPRDVFPALIPRGLGFGWPLTGYRCAIDSPERLEQARADLARGLAAGPCHPPT